MPDKPITTDDLRRAVRYCIAIYEGDGDTMRRVAEEVQRLGRWSELALSCGLVNRVVLTKVDVFPEDEGAIALWLHAAVEQIVDDGDAWWTIEDGDDDD